MIADWYDVMTDFLLNFSFKEIKSVNCTLNTKSACCTHFRVHGAVRIPQTSIHFGLIGKLANNSHLSFQKSWENETFFKKDEKKLKKKLVFCTYPIVHLVESDVKKYPHRDLCMWYLCHFLLLYFILSLCQSTTTQPIWQ